MNMFPSKAKPVLAAVVIVFGLQGCSWLQLDAPPNFDSLASSRVHPTAAHSLEAVQGGTAVRLVAEAKPVVTPEVAASVASAQAVETVKAPVAVAATSKRSEFDSNEAAVTAALQAWRNDWMAGDASRYIKRYSASFKGELASRAAWEKQRRQRLANIAIRVQLGNLKTRVEQATVVTEFTQRYLSAGHEDSGVKTLHWQKEEGEWRIVREEWRKS